MKSQIELPSIMFDKVRFNKNIFGTYLTDLIYHMTHSRLSQLLQILGRIQSFVSGTGTNSKQWFLPGR